MIRILILGLLILVLSGVSSAQADHLFSPDAGFAKAKTEPRQSLEVWADPTLSFALSAAIGPWNGLAGWPLFAVTQVYDDADIWFVQGNTWVCPGSPPGDCDKTRFGEPYEACTINFELNATTHTAQHELGHCLGFVDHTGDQGDYSGVMAYKDWFSDVWFGADDRQMLIDAGYTTEELAGTIDPPKPWWCVIRWFSWLPRCQ